MNGLGAVFDCGLTEDWGQMHSRDGEIWDLPVLTWRADAGPGDECLLSRCRGTTLDVGCGPGRMTAALTLRGVRALGVDVSPLAVAMTRSRGASALHRDIFSMSVGERLWDHALLADGNVGIGGDPVRLLGHCRELVTQSGSVLLDLSPPGRGLQVTTVRMVGTAGPGAWFPWARLGVDAVETVAAAAGLAVAEVWRVEEEIPRWQGELIRSPRESPKRRPSG